MRRRNIIYISLLICFLTTFCANAMEISVKPEPQTMATYHSELFYLVGRVLPPNVGESPIPVLGVSGGGNRLVEISICCEFIHSEESRSVTGICNASGGVYYSYTGEHSPNLTVLQRFNI